MTLRHPRERRRTARRVHERGAVRPSPRFLALAAACCAALFAPDARASGDVFGDCVGCAGGGSGPTLGGGGAGGKNGFSGLSMPLLGGSFAGLTLSFLYDVPVFLGAPVGELPRGWLAFGAGAGALGVGLGTATIIDGATVHDGVGGIVFGGAAVGLGAIALATSLPSLLSRRATSQPVHAAIVTDGSRLRLGMPAPWWVRDVASRSAPVVPIFGGVL